MERCRLQGFDAHNKPCQYGKDVVNFGDNAKRFGVTPIVVKGQCKLILSTARGSYELEYHGNQNYWFGTCAGTKVQISLGKVTGEIRWWKKGAK